MEPESSRSSVRLSLPEEEEEEEALPSTPWRSPPPSSPPPSPPFPEMFPAAGFPPLAGPEEDLALSREAILLPSETPLEEGVEWSIVPPSAETEAALSEGE